MTVWGPIVAAPTLRKAITTTLKLWLPATFAETARQSGLTTAQVTALPVVQTWKSIAATDPARIPEDQLPAVFVTSPGVGARERHGDGTYTFRWNATVTVVARSQSYEETADLVGLYVAAIRAVCVQRPSFGGFAQHTELDEQPEDYSLLDSTISRSLAAGFVDLIVTVDSVVDAKGGPKTPPVDPLAPAGNLGTVLTQKMTVKPKA